MQCGTLEGLTPPWGSTPPPGAPPFTRRVPTGVSVREIAEIIGFFPIIVFNCIDSG